MAAPPQFRNLNQMCFEEFLLKCHQDVIKSRLKLSGMPLELGVPSLESLTGILPYLSLNVDEGLPDENLAKFLLLRCEALHESKYDGLQISSDILRDVKMCLRSGHLGAAERWRALVLLLKYVCVHSHSVEIPSSSSDLDFERSIEIRYTPDKGRSIFAKQDLEIGAIVSSERPLVAFIHSKHSDYSHCVHCFRTTFNPLPCPSCNHSVFCSLACLGNKKSHHYYECQMGLDGIIDKLCPKTSMPLGKILILRLITQRNYRFFRSKYSNEEFDYTYFGQAAGSLDEAYDRLWHKIRIFTNDDGSKKLSFMDGFFYLLKKTTDYFEDALASDFENVYRTMQHYEAILDGNSFTLEEFYDRKRILGSALYDYSSFYNHSCDPNACFIFDSAKRLRIIVTSPVSGGEEITISYGPLVWNQGYEERLNKLKNYNFICRCIACRDKISPGEENDPHFRINELQDQPEVVLEKIAKGEYGEVCSNAKLKNIIHLCSWFLYGQ